MTSRASFAKTLALPWNQQLMQKPVTLLREPDSGRTKFWRTTGFEVVKEYRDCGVSGRRARRPGLDAFSCVSVDAG